MNCQLQLNEHGVERGENIYMNKSDQFDGLLYFAQRMQEAIFYYTIDIYKAPILNTNQLAREYIDVYSSVSKNKINNNHLDEIKSEFLCSLEHDIVLKEYWGEENIVLVKNIICSQNNNSVFKTMHYLASIWDNCVYYDWCKKYTKEIIQEPIQKKKIEQAIRCLLPEFYAYGYSSEYIYKKLKKHLFDKRPDFSQLDKFLSEFSLKDSEYKVYLAVNKEILLFKEMLQENLTISFDDDGNFSKLKHDENFVVVSFEEVLARDEYRALEITRNALDIFLMFYMALDNKQKIDIGDTAMVHYGKKFDSLPSKEAVMKPIEKYESTEVGKMAIEKIFSFIHHDAVTIGILSKIFEKHNIALMDSNAENCFLNMWSILEIFSESIEDGSKIEKIRKSVLIIIANNYFKRIIIDIAKNLKSVLKQEKYDYFINKVSEDGDEIYKMAYLIFLEDYKELRDELNIALIKFPNLRSRMAQLNSLGGNAKQLFAILSKYKERVSWHLARMYRGRNSIIHSGESVASMTSLLEHLHSYVDILIDEFVDNLTAGMGLNNIDDIILYNQLREERIFKAVNVDKRINKDMISLLLK